MKSYEVFDGKRYLFTVMPSDNPMKVLQEERKIRHNPGLSLVCVENGQRYLAEGPSVPEPVEEDDFSAYAEDEDEE